MTGEWLIISSLFSICFCHFSDPFVQDFGDIRYKKKSILTKRTGTPNSNEASNQYGSKITARLFSPAKIANNFVEVRNSLIRKGENIRSGNKVQYKVPVINTGEEAVDAKIAINMASLTKSSTETGNEEKYAKFTQFRIPAKFARSEARNAKIADNIPVLTSREGNQQDTRSIQNKEPRPIVSSKVVDGTPKHFKQLVIGRCWEYQMRIGLKDKEQIDCDKVWNYFMEAFAFKGPCDVKTKDYEEFLEKIEEDVPKDKALLWSGCRELAHKYSDFAYTKRFVTLEDTLAGYLFAGLSWCGSKGPPGINYDGCPYECSIQAPYWAMANLQFAKKVKGVVQILLNGTREHQNDGKIYPSYLKDRYYFGPYVVPNLDAKKVTEVRIIVAHTLRLKPLEKCNQASVKELQQDLKRKGIKTTCYDDPDFVKHLQCVDEPMLAECRIR